MIPFLLLTFQVLQEMKIDVMTLIIFYFVDQILNFKVKSNTNCIRSSVLIDRKDLGH